MNKTPVILFRGKRLDGRNEWVEGGYYQEDYTGFVYITFWNSFGLGFMDSYRVDPTTVGQYIGLTDKYGKKAFAGDITRDCNNRLWVVFACPGGFGTCVVAEWGNRDTQPDFIYNGLSERQNADWFSENHEIVGNIYDNPELLKGCERS